MGGKKTVGTIIGESIRYFRRNFKIFFITALFVYGFTYLLKLFIPFVMDLFEINAESIDLFFDRFASENFYWLSPLFSLLSILLLYAMASTISRLLSLPVDMLYINASDVMIQISHGIKPRIKAIALNFKYSWKRYLGISAWVSLWTWLWYLVFFIPGLVMSYSYMLAPYLVLEYPDMTVRKALKKSKEITMGYKGRLFGLELLLGLPYMILIDFPDRIFNLSSQYQSYYVILDIIFSIVALMILEPLGYMMFTTAYLDIKQAAIDKGLLPPAAGQEGGTPVDTSVAAVDTSVKLQG